MDWSERRASRAREPAVQVVLWIMDAIALFWGEEVEVEVEVVGKVSAAVPGFWEGSWNAQQVPGYYSLSMTFLGALSRRIYKRWDQTARRAA